VPFFLAGSEHALLDKPHVVHGGGAHDRCEDLLHDGGEESTEDRLIANIPCRVLRIGDLAPDFIVASAGDLLYGGRWGLGDAGDVAKEVRVATEVGDHLSSPQHVVGVV
jgi:hypothetical protein